VRLRRYLRRLQDTIYSRREIEVEHLRIEEMLPDRMGAIEGRLRFYDGSLLEFDETLIVKHLILIKTDYSYHYQRADASLVFRYDNAPHHPELPGFPCHKHIGERVVPADPPDLSEVLREIDDILYNSGTK